MYTPFPVYGRASLESALPPTLSASTAFYHDAIDTYYYQTTFTFKETLRSHPPLGSRLRRFNSDLSVRLSANLKKVSLEHGQSLRLLWHGWEVSKSSFGGSLLQSFPKLDLLQVEYNYHSCLLNITVGNVVNLMLSDGAEKTEKRLWGERTRFWLRDKKPREFAKCACPPLIASGRSGVWNEEQWNMLKGIKELRFSCIATEEVKLDIAKADFGEFRLVRSETRDDCQIWRLEAGEENS